MLGCGDTPCAPCALRKAQTASLSGLEAPLSVPGVVGIAAVTFGALWLLSGSGLASNRKRRYKEVTWPKSIYWDFPDSPEVEKPKPKKYKWWKHVLPWSRGLPRRHRGHRQGGGEDRRTSGGDGGQG